MAKAEMTVHVEGLPEVKARLAELSAAVLWFWNDMREVDRMYLRGDQPELVALCESLASGFVPPDDDELASDEPGGAS